MVGWFIYQTLSLALHIRIGIPPDEHHHIYLSLYYRDAIWFTPVESEDTYRFGPILIYPYLYHLIVGKLLWLNFFWKEPEPFLRVLNVIISTATVITSYSLFREVSKSALARLLALLTLTNIPMFVFISSAISYDNLTFLLATLMMLYSVRFLKEKKLEHLLSATLYLFLGALCKVVFLPFCLIYFVLLLALSYRIVPDLIKNIKLGLNLREKILLVFVIGATIANARLYGGNYMQYGSIFPSPETVLGTDVALKYFPQARRDEDLRRTALTREALPPSEYVSHYYMHVIRTSIGIMAHKHSYLTDEQIKSLYKVCIPFMIGLLFAAMIGIWKFFQPISETTDGILFVFLVSFAYILITLTDSYNGYTIFRIFGLGLQGRYLFSVLPGICIIFSTLSLFWIPRRFQFVAFLSIAYFVFIRGIYSFLPVLMDKTWGN